MCAPKFAPNRKKCAPKKRKEWHAFASAVYSKNPLEPLQFQGVFLVETTELESVTSRV